jgi:hypothetical protein
MDKMRALQFRLIRNLHARLLAVRQVTQENQRKKDPDIYKKLVALGSQKIEIARGLQLDGKATPIRQIIISKPQEEKKHPIKLRAKKNIDFLAPFLHWAQENVESIRHALRLENGKQKTIYIFFFELNFAFFYLFGLFVLSKTERSRL